MELFLDGNDLMAVTDGTLAKPATDADDWLKKDRKAKMLIASALEYGQLQHVVNCTTASEMWEKLLVINEKKSATSLYMLQQQFFEYKMDVKDTVAAHITKIETLAKKLKELGAEQQESAIITKVLCSLPPLFRNVITAWDSTPTAQQTLNELTSRLLKEEALLKQWECDSVPKDAFAAFAKRMDTGGENANNDCDNRIRKSLNKQMCPLALKQKLKMHS
ncbi:uncharacterized protein B4U80_02798 [Leptotrombidium deliense]|uniref:Uncharacterized protein n=1 Tax=Leptotrombidium deliense TaxID=299467 RepID=A0A443S2Z4_9ACAR|nr:uncharacterized protein B4U80_02798 [Leptotrombidium deliense]